jgi:hypothetical protein
MKLQNYVAQGQAKKRILSAISMTDGHSLMREKFLFHSLRVLGTGNSLFYQEIYSNF